MSITIVYDANGQPMTVQSFDHEAFAAFKARQRDFHKQMYASNPGIRAARSATNKAAYRARKARKIATAETN
jgi:hypothetical protein